MQVKKQPLEPDMKKQTGFKSGKKYIKAIYYMSPCLFCLYAVCLMQNPGLEEAQAGIKIAGRNTSDLRCR